MHNIIFTDIYFIVTFSWNNIKWENEKEFDGLISLSGRSQDLLKKIL